MPNRFNDVTVVIPTLNEASNIALLLDKLTDYYPGLRIIVCDDNSSDGTQEIVRRFALEKVDRQCEIRLIERMHVPVSGLTASVLDGVSEVGTTYMLVMDGDLQHPPEVLRHMLNVMKEKDVDLVVGARLPYCERQGFHRVLITQLATWAAHVNLFLKGFRVKDPMSGLFLVKASLMKSVVLEKRERFEEAGYKVLFDFLRVAPSELEIENHDYDFGIRPGGTSKLRPAHALYFLRSMLK